MQDPDFDKWDTQLRKGLVELLVMRALASAERAHGYELLSRIEAAGVQISEGTLYPLLNRLDKNGWLSSNWETGEQTASARPRRYYRLSPHGEQLLPELEARFNSYIRGFHKIGGLE